MLKEIARKRVAMISGWAVDPNAIYLIKLMRISSFGSTLITTIHSLCRSCAAKRVLTVHGFARVCARSPRKIGVEAWALSEENHSN